MPGAHASVSDAQTIVTSDAAIARRRPSASASRPPTAEPNSSPIAWSEGIAPSAPSDSS